jgi:tetratricopeptide (TPR) repeat protein
LLLASKHQTDYIDPITLIIESIQDQKLAVFCGAGISRHSGIPIASQFVNHVLEKLECSPNEKEIIENSVLPFEAFVEIVAGDTDIDEVLKVFEFESPNPNHRLIAELCKRKQLKTICTTNFDVLIEKALYDAKLVRDRDYIVYSEEDAFNRIQWADDTIKVIKLHGSIHNKKDVAITLKRVAARDLSQGRFEVIKNMFSSGPHSHVIVMGYSCSDAFDICPQIEALQNNLKKVFYINHNETLSGFEVKDLTEKPGKNPFKKFRGSCMITVKTEDLVETIWERCLPGVDIPNWESCLPEVNIPKVRPTKSETESEPEWKSIIDEWAKKSLVQHSKSTPLHCKGSLFSAIGQSRMALDVFEDALQIAETEGSSAAKYCALGDIGHVYRFMGRYGEAIEYGTAALQIAKTEGNHYGTMLQLSNLGIAYRKTGDLEASVKVLSEAEQIALGTEDKAGRAEILGNLGNSYRGMGRLSDAIQCYEEAIRVAQEIGNKRAEAAAWGGLGSIYSDQGDFEDSRVHYDKALEIASMIGDRKGEGTALGNIASALCMLHRYDEAKKTHNLALDIMRETGYREGEATQLGGLGNICFAQQDFANALRNFQDARHIYEEIKNRKGEAQCLGSIGNVYGCLGKPRIALGYHQQAVAIYEEIGDHMNLGFSLINLANDQLQMGNFREAMRHLKRAYSLLLPILPSNHPQLENLRELLS